MQLSDAIKARRSIRKYKEGASVSDEQIKMLLEAAMLAPSACNDRAFEFVVVRNRGKLNEIMEAHPHTGMLKTASLAIAVCGVPDAMPGFSEAFFPQDCAAATQNILLMACDLGLGSCWCGVYPRENFVSDIRRILELPENKIPYNIIAIGIADEAPAARGAYEPGKVRFLD